MDSRSVTLNANILYKVPPLCHLHINRKVTNTHIILFSPFTLHLNPIFPQLSSINPPILSMFVIHMGIQLFAGTRVVAVGIA